MKTLYISCEMGVAGDMLTGALLELFDNPEEIVKELNGFNIPGVVYEYNKTSKCGIQGTHMHVKVNGEEESEHMHDHHHHHDHDHHDHLHEEGHHHHSNLHSIGHIVNDHMHVSEKVKKDIMAVFNDIAQAESKVHGMDIDEIHFHEVGTMDAVADIAAVCYLIDKLDVDEIVVSSIHVGSGTVKCAHGILPVPAPATALLLQGVPIYSDPNIVGELCTPTGAALLKHFANRFDVMPAMVVEKTGYGMGTKDFERANCVRVILGQSSNKVDEVVEISFNVDDMSGEEISYAFDKLMANGVRDVFTFPINMKKNRPGILMNVVCLESDREKVLELIFKHTSTIGVRETKKNRYVLDRDIKTISTKYGDVRVKKSSGYGSTKRKYEFDDLARIATETNKSISEIKKELEKEYE